MRGIRNKKINKKRSGSKEREGEREREGGEKEAVKGVIGRGKSGVESIVGCLL